MGPADIIRRKLATASRLDPFVAAWLVPAWILIGLSALAIRLVPLRKLAPGFGRNLGAVAFVPCADEARCHRAQKIRQVINIAARYAPFRSDCYPQAIAALLLCRLYRVPYALHFGAALRPGESGRRELKAHAWVVSGPVAVCGGNASFGAYGVVSCFVG